MNYQTYKAAVSRVRRKHEPINTLFVYGTMRNPYHRKLVTGYDFDTEPAVLYNYRRIHPRNGYPFAIHWRGSKIEGQIIYGITPDVFKKLDEYELEGTLYLRKVVRVLLGESEQFVTTYVYIGIPEALEPYFTKGIEQDDRIEEFVETNINKYLEGREDLCLIGAPMPLPNPGTPATSVCVINVIGDQYPYLVIDNEAGLEHLSRRVMRTIDLMLVVTDPTVRGMAADGIPYSGFLYAGLMIDAAGTPRVLEFNCRLGDPETQPIMMRLRSDLFELIERAMSGKLDETEAEWDRRAALGVVLAAANYPEAPRKGDVISGLDARGDDFHVFHAGTDLADDKVVTAGGRVLCVTALGDSIKMARARAYQVVDAIRFDGMQYRTDIGHRAIEARRPG